MSDPWSVDPWESVARAGYASDDEEDVPSFDGISREEAAEQLGNYIVFLKRSAVLSAKQACVLAFWAKAAGVEGLVEQLAVPPDGDHFSRKFDTAARADVEGSCERYEVTMPCYRRTDHTQSSETVPIVTPLDCVRAEVEANAALPGMLEAVVAARQLPEMYFEHPAVRSAPAGVPVYPYSLYFDGVPITRTDGALCCYLVNMLTDVPFLLAVLRKSEMCQCGCRHWCSIYVLLRALGWSIEHGSAIGREPLTRHDGEGWRASDSARASRAGEPLPWRMVVLFLKGDLMEHSSTLGFPSTSAGDNPCARCWSNIGSWAKIAGLSAVDCPWPLKTWADYDHACRRCEIHVTITAGLFPSLRAAMDYDKRPQGSRGFALVTDFPALGLIKGDRLEVHPGMERLELFHSRARPFDAVFWRRSAETMCRRRNPLFGESGVAPDKCMVPEPLHALSLGVYQFWISTVWHALMEANVFEHPEQTAGVRKQLFAREVCALA